MRKRLYVDIESTGLDPRLHGIHQISGEIVIDGKLVEQFNLHPRPFEDDVIIQDALDTSEVTAAELWARELLPKQAHDQLEAIFGRYVNRYDETDKFQLFGYNVEFDSDFLRAFFVKNGNDYYAAWVWFPPHDAAPLAWRIMEADGVRRDQLEDFKLGTVAKYFGLGVAGDERLHDAKVDISFTRQIVEACERRLVVMPTRKSRLFILASVVHDLSKHLAPGDLEARVRDLATRLHALVSKAISYEEAETLAWIELR